ncbi:MAG: hypothetical protein IKQ33_05145 [Clostridia bacterium]|nr:hypothetical protein [Clostridia bacterium]
MKKLGKVLSLLLIVFVLFVALTTNVMAADSLDLSGYNEIGGEEEITTETPKTTTEEKTTTPETTTPAPATTTTTTETTGTTTVTKTEEKKPDVVTENIAQAGSVATTIFVSAGLVLVVALGIGYKKLKRYSF